LPDTTVDVPALYRVLDQRRRQRGLTWRLLAKEIDVSPSTFTRMAQGHRPDVDTFLTFLRWLNLPAESVARGQVEEGPADEIEPLTAITSFLRASRKVTPEEAEALTNIIEAAFKSIVKDG